ncbi:MAG: hypothetical protein ABJA34_05965 [Pseudonocardiales bacterium]
MILTKRTVLAAALIALTVAGCSSKAATPKAAPKSTGSNPAVASPSGGPPSQKAAPVEKSPPGDIPDNIAYVSYHNAAGRYTFKHPEGWAALASGAIVTFTDKLNGVSAAPGQQSAAPTVASANQTDVPALETAQPAFELRKVIATALPAGSGVLIVYRRNSAPDPVTGKVLRDEVQRYEVYGDGHEVILELFGAVGSDNVDPYRIMAQSLRLA